MFEHRIQDDRRFPHAGGQGYFFGFAGRTQALIERADHGIEPGGHDEGGMVSGTIV
jgi:hypothetical protein